MGVLASLIKLKAISSAGILTATVSNPAVTIPEINSDFLRTKVRGPGQNALANFKATGVTCLDNLCNSFISAI